jgi:hypothetical protein
MSVKISKIGYDDATCGNGFNEMMRGNYSYTEGYRLGLEKLVTWATEDLAAFNEQNPQ